MRDRFETEADAGTMRAALAKLNRRLRALDEPGGVGSTGLSLLGRLFRDGPSTATALASQERLQPQSLTRVLQAMEAQALILRTPDESDRRRASIAITARGTDILRQSVRKRESWLAKALLSTLSATERDLLRLAVSLIERLADAED